VIHDSKSIINFVHCIVKLSLIDDKRWGNVKNRGTNPHEDSILKKSLLELNNLLWVRILEESLNKLSVLSY